MGLACEDNVCGCPACECASPCVRRALLVGPPETKPSKTFSNGYLGYCNDEERSEMRYAMRIAEFRESSDL